MSWVRLDDSMPTNPKVLAAPVGARYLYVVGLCYCARELTDGVIPSAALPIILATAGAAKRAPADLVAAGLWVEEGTNFVVPDYLEFNPSREQVLADRAKAKERQRKFRESQRDRRRDNGRSNGGSSPSPTPPPPVGGGGVSCISDRLPADLEPDPPAAPMPESVRAALDERLARNRTA